MLCICSFCQPFLQIFSILMLLPLLLPLPLPLHMWLNPSICSNSYFDGSLIFIIKEGKKSKSKCQVIFVSMNEAVLTSTTIGNHHHHHPHHPHHTNIDNFSLRNEQNCYYKMLLNRFVIGSVVAEMDGKILYVHLLNLCTHTHLRLTISSSSSWLLHFVKFALLTCV